MLDTMFLLVRMIILAAVWEVLHFWQVPPHIWVRDLLVLPISLTMSPVVAYMISCASEEVQEQAIRGAAYGARDTLATYGCSERWIVYITGT